MSSINGSLTELLGEYESYDSDPISWETRDGVLKRQSVWLSAAAMLWNSSSAVYVQEKAEGGTGLIHFMGILQNANPWALEIYSDMPG